MSKGRARLMTRAFALLLGLLATSSAWASGPERMIVVVPQAEYPDVVVIGNGWPDNMTNGCLDRHQCAAPKPGARVKLQAMPAGAPVLSDIPTSPAGGKS